VLGTTSQILHNNWKLYFENVRDTYHATLLHTFFTTFRISRLTSEGGVDIAESGAHHASYTRNKVDRVDPANSDKLYAADIPRNQPVLGRTGRDGRPAKTFSVARWRSSAFAPEGIRQGDACCADDAKARR